MSRYGLEDWQRDSNYKLSLKNFLSIKEFINKEDFLYENLYRGKLIYKDKTEINYKDELISYVNYAISLFDKYREEKLNKRNKLVYNDLRSYTPFKPVIAPESEFERLKENANHLLICRLDHKCRYINDKYTNPKKPKINKQKDKNTERDTLLYAESEFELWMSNDYDTGKRKTRKLTELGEKIFNTTYEDMLNMSYEECINYLNLKHGYVENNYITHKGDKKYPQGVLSLVGIECHHVNEINIPNLSDEKVALSNEFENQKAENLVFCDLLEHLILHFKIMESGRKNSYNGCNAIIYRLDNIYNKYKEISNKEDKKSKNIKESMELEKGNILNNYDFYIKLKNIIKENK